MMINYLLLANIKLGITLCMLMNLYAAEHVLWDLGVVIKTNNTETYQKELNIDALETKPSARQKDIKALYSDNFIAPTVYEFKNPLKNDFNITKTYDKLLEHLSLDYKIHILKNSFLNKEYWKFLSLHSILQTNIKNDIELEEMYVQNLYYTKKHKETLSHLDSIDNNQLTDILLFYKIKALVQLKQTNEALENITLFISNYSDSDLLPYVQYDKKTIEMTNEN